MKLETPLLKVDGLRKYFPIRRGFFRKHVGDVKAVDGVSFTLNEHETLGLVGESGCGKTTVGRSILRLEEPSAGSALFRGEDLFTLSNEEMRRKRRELQLIFQDPYSSLNPRMTVETIVGEAMHVHGVASGKALRERVAELLERVGLQASYASRYPHEFSGGQRQRIGIARALALNPSLIVCDESVSALDVSVQAQVINLLQDLQEEFDLSYLFIAHDLSVVRHISDKVAVMYLGRIMELARTEDLFAHPAHPYTQALLSAIPRPDPHRKRERIILEGDVPSPASPPSGCPFQTRCPAAWERCRTERPELRQVASEHVAACHLYDEPSRSGMTLPQAQQDVARVVRAGAGVGPQQRSATRSVTGAHQRAVDTIIDSAREAAEVPESDNPEGSTSSKDEERPG